MYDKKRKGYMGGGMYDKKRKKYFGGSSDGDGFTAMRKAKMAYGSGGKARKPMKHGGEHGYSSIKDLEDSCNRMVGYNTMEMKGDK